MNLMRGSHREYCESEAIQGMHPLLESFSTDQTAAEIAQDMTDNEDLLDLCAINYVTFKNNENVKYQSFI